MWQPRRRRECADDPRGSRGDPPRPPRTIARRPARRYHTQIDRYVRFYTAKHSMVDKLRPRIAVQKLFSTFYGGCDVIAVPNTAIADKLVLKMAIPREKIGFFPRGVNTTHYSPRKRSVEWRRDRFGANV